MRATLNMRERDHSSGIFVNLEPKIFLFNITDGMTI